MAPDRIPIEPPLGGLSDREAASRQRARTTRKARNVRGLDPVTGRRRLAQRAGLTSICETKLGDGPVRAAESLTWDRPRILYTGLTGESSGRGTPDKITVVWDDAPVTGDITRDAQVDLEGNVYALEGSTTITKRNADGEIVAKVVLPLQTLEAIVPKIQVDAFGNLFAAAASTVDGGGSRLWRYRLSDKQEGEEETNRYLLVWQINTAGRITDFALTASVLYVAQEFQSGDTLATLSLYTLILGPEPGLAWETAIPYPCSVVTVTPTGEAITSHPPNANRGVAGTGTALFETPVVSWTPYELVNSRERLHFWLDQGSLPASSDGQAVTNWTDRRFLEPLQPQPYDTVDRRATASTSGSLAPRPDGASASYPQNSQLVRSRPTYDPTGWGLVGPAVKFNGASPATPNSDGLLISNSYLSPFSGQILVTGRTTAVGGKKDVDGDGVPDPEGTHEGALTALYPYNGQDVAFATFIAFRVPADANPLKPQLVFSSGIVGDGPTSRSVAVWVHRGSSSTTVAPLEVVVEITGITGNGGTGAFLLAGELDPATRVGILSLVINRATTHTAFTTETINCSARLNGRPMDRFGLAGSPWANVGDGTRGRMDTFGHWLPSGSLNIGESGLPLGAGHASHPNGDLGIASQWHQDFEGFTGWVVEALTILGNTLVAGLDISPNNLPVTQPLRDAGATINPGKPQARDLTFGGTVEHTGSIDHPDEALIFTTDATEVELVEGYLAHRLGVPDALPSEVWADGTADRGAQAQDTGAGNSQLWKHHPFGGTGRGPQGASSNVLESATARAMRSPKGIVAKWSPSLGDVVWAFAGGGVGYGHARSLKGKVFCVGPVDEDPLTTEEEVLARALRDFGTQVSALPDDGAWTILGPVEEAQTQRVRLAADEDGDFYWPIINGPAALSLRQDYGGNTLVKLAGEGGAPLWFYALPTDGEPQAVALVEQAFPIKEQEVRGPEFCYVASSVGDQSPSGLWKLRLVAAHQDVADGISTRRTELVAVSRGAVWVKSAGEEPYIPSGGDGVVLQTSPYVALALHDDKVFGTDGMSAWVYDPRKRLVEPYKLKSAGELPQRFKLLASWNKRLVMARADSSATNWWMTRQDDPFDLDLFPAVAGATDAVAGNGLRGPGLSPSPITALMPLSDDLLLVGHGSSISRLTGDPLAGGAWDLVSDKIGVQFGGAWTKSALGIPYFVSSRGGVFSMTAEGVRPVSNDSIERRLQAVDYTRFRVVMAYSYELEGIYVLQVPMIGRGVPARGWFYDIQGRSWWEDDYVQTNVQPTCAVVMDGDTPGERALVFGCEDGGLRKVDRGAPDDDGVAIHSEVWMSLHGPDQASTMRVANPQATLASMQGGANLELMVGAAADSEGVSAGRGRLDPGPNPALKIRARGAAVWAVLESAEPGERWALEELWLRAYRAGRRRVR